MITIIFGLPGAGKTAFMTYLLKTMYEERKNELFKFTYKKILEINKEYGTNFTLPTQTPIFINTNYDVKFKIGFAKEFVPYVFNIKKFGVPIEDIDPKKKLKSLQFVPPGAKLFIPEFQKYINSHEWEKVPKETRTAFEEHRQWWLDFFIDVQRPVMVAAAVRELASRFIHVVKHENVCNFAGGVESTTFHTLEFSSWQETEDYVKNGKTTGGVRKKYVYNGNIFKCYDSYSCRKDFIPTAKDQDFTYE